MKHRSAFNSATLVLDHLSNNLAFGITLLLRCCLDVVGVELANARVGVNRLWWNGLDYSQQRLDFVLNVDYPGIACLDG